jgi:acyl carrier protein
MGADRGRTATAAEIEAWLTRHVSETLRLAPHQVGPHKTFEQLGMGSLEGVALVAALEEWIGRPLDATIIWDFPTISGLATHLGTAEPPGSEN